MLRKVPILGIISIHALLAESDVEIAEAMGTTTTFLSTLSLRRATFFQQVGQARILYFYPRSPCGERLFCKCEKRMGSCISIHALLAESDVVQPLTNNSTTKFLSTLSLRRATAEETAESEGRVISIHALLAESDSWA